LESFVFFGVGSAIVVDYAETCRRLGHGIAAGVENRQTRRYLGPETRTVTPDQLTPDLLRLPCLTPLFTPANRAVAVQEAIGLGLAFPLPLVDPTAIAAHDLVVGGGSFINAGVVIGACSVIGHQVVINRAASIGHHARIADFASLGPGATLAGEVTVGTGAMIGAAAIILPGVTIGDHAVIGAGAIITRDVPANAKMLGVKARAVDS
jgi:sugar O-acyltransferase (sialic acid O-acetyltransferase NeuD family)